MIDLIKDYGVADLLAMAKRQTAAMKVMSKQVSEIEAENDKLKKIIKDALALWNDSYDGENIGVDVFELLERATSIK